MKNNCPIITLAKKHGIDPTTVVSVEDLPIGFRLEVLELITHRAYYEGLHATRYGGRYFKEEILRLTNLYNQLISPESSTSHFQFITYGLKISDRVTKYAFKALGK